MNFKIFHIETDEEIIVKFTIWVQTFWLYPIKKTVAEIYKWENIESLEFTKKMLEKALNNLKI